jgi:hypothetical protein
LTELIRIRAEPCAICKKTLPMCINSNELKPNVTGLDLFLDLHGLDDDPSHARLLYIDSNGFVRTISTITKFTRLLHQNAQEK